jgi:hypothetical protein
MHMEVTIEQFGKLMQAENKDEAVSELVTALAIVEDPEEVRLLTAKPMGIGWA